MGPALAAWLTRAFPAGLVVEDRCLPAAGLYPWFAPVRLLRGGLPVAAAEAVLLDQFAPGDGPPAQLIALAEAPRSTVARAMLLVPPGAPGGGLARLALRDAAGRGRDLLGPAETLTGLPPPRLEPAPPVARLAGAGLIMTAPATGQVRLLLGVLPGVPLRLGLRLDGQQAPALFVDGVRHPAEARADSAGFTLHALFRPGAAATILGLARTEPIEVLSLTLDPA